MSGLPGKRLTVDEFLAWAETQEGVLRLDPPGLEVAIADFFTSMGEATKAAG